MGASTRRARLILMLATTLGVGLCPGAGWPADIELIISQKSDIETFDPAMTSDTSTHNVNINIFDTLIRLSEDGKDFTPELAESWKVLNPTTWQFKLRRGVKFTNGEEFNAEAVKFTIETILDPARKTRQRPALVAIKEVRVDDPYTVSVITDGPYAILLTQLSVTMIVPPRYSKEVGFPEFARRPVGTGAFKLKEWRKDVHVILEPNEQSWKGRPKIQRLLFRPIPEDAARIAALQRGEVHLIDAVPYDRIPELQAARDLKVTARQGEMLYIGLDTLKFEPFKKREVRQAVNYAVNVEAIIKTLLLGQATHLTGPLFPASPGYDPDLKLYAFDPERAKRVLAQAGYPNGFDIEFAISPTQQGVAKGLEISQAIAEQLRKVGVRAKLTLLESAAMFDQYSARKLQMYLYPWKSNPESGRHIQTLIHSKTRGYYYQNPEADKMVEAYFSAMDSKRRIEIGRELHRWLAEEAPWIFLYQQQDVYGVRKTIAWEAKPDYLLRMRDVTVQR